MGDGTGHIAWCPVCPANLAVEHEGDRIEHVGPIVRVFPWGEHRFITHDEEEDR